MSERMSDERLTKVLRGLYPPDLHQGLRDMAAELLALRSRLAALERVAEEVANELEVKASEINDLGHGMHAADLFDLADRLAALDKEGRDKPTPSRGATIGPACDCRTGEGGQGGDSASAPSPELCSRAEAAEARAQEAVAVVRGLERNGALLEIRHRCNGEVCGDEGCAGWWECRGCGADATIRRDDPDTDDSLHVEHKDDCPVIAARRLAKERT